MDHADNMQAAVLELVNRILDHEAQRRVDRDSTVEATLRAAEKLREHLSKRIGAEGFRSLFARSLARTKANNPSLASVEVASDGSLRGLRDAAGLMQSDEDVAKAGVLILAPCLELLNTFIGEALTLRIIRSGWPDIDFEVVTGQENDTT